MEDSNRTSFAVNSGFGLEWKWLAQYGAYWPNISTDAEPPPKSPQMPSAAAWDATDLAAADAAAEAAIADEEGEVGTESFSILELRFLRGSQAPAETIQGGKVK